MSSDLQLLEELLSHRPSPLRRTTLLEGVEMSRSEVPQSLLLGWLLGPQGPLTECWLLKALLRRAAPSVTWPSDVCTVLPEVAVDSERPDIVAEWESFKLIVEYKVDSPEGADQVQRYLKTFKIESASDGVVIYLTPRGKWPSSVEAGDARVSAISFDHLIDCIDDALDSQQEQSERGRVFAAEYRDCLKRVRNRSINMTKPVVSPATKLLCKHHVLFDRLMVAAKQDTAEFIEHFVTRAGAEMRAILGDGVVVSPVESWGYFTFRKPTWATDVLEFGIAYGLERKAGTRRMDEYEHNLSVQVRSLDQTVNSAPGQKAFAQSLREALRPHLAATERDGGTNQYFACFGPPIPFKPDNDWDKWAAATISTLSDFARRLTPPIDKFVQTLPARDLRTRARAK